MNLKIKYFLINNTLFNLLLLLLISRLFFFSIGLSPDLSHLPQMWQLLNPDLLYKDYFKSILYLHSQPPIWNAIFGIFIKLFGTDYQILNDVMHLFNIFCSILITVYFFLICKEFNFNRKIIYILFFIFVAFSPPLIMYENFIHYTNLSVLLFTIISYNLIKFGEKYNFIREIQIYFFLILLMYTWSAFSHPVVLVGIFTLIFFLKKEKRIKSFLLFIIVLFISFIPSIKNKFFFNYFSNTTWPGLQLTQVLERYDYKYPLCSYNLIDIPLHENKYKQDNPDKNFNHPSIVGEKSRYNTIALIYRSKKCLPFAINLIKDDPLNFIKIVKFNLISSHGHFTFDFGQKPKNWDNIFGFFDDLKLNDFTNRIKVRSIQLYHLIFHIFFLFLIFRSIFKFKKKYSYDFPFIAIYFLYSWIIFISHVGAGFEFERMRHTGHAMHIIFLSLMIKNNFNFFRYFKNEKSI